MKEEKKGEGWRVCGEEGRRRGGGGGGVAFMIEVD